MVNLHGCTIGTGSSFHLKRTPEQCENKMTGEGESILRNQRAGFTSGVVEGFYGRPWTTEQRKLLFTWMNKMGLNTYMYAPKDDCKHRVYWRELYSVEEADNLTNLIQAAHGCGITFVYAISPGLDITFSSSKDVQFLKRKLNQVGTFGCNAFAILFDDIDPELCEADKSVFQSSACAQVSITNEVYEHLGQPTFLFCPTEYCASRAVPNVTSSGYLNTIGSKLLPGIDVLWTGPRVVSKKLSIQSLEEIAAVLKRPPVIWDNIHANDYDPRRIFLGPYDYRSPEIIPYVRGIMTNPNTEFEANFIPCHTLAQWCKSNPDGVKKDIIAGDRLSPVVSDIKLETENDFTPEGHLPCRLDTRYQAKQALKTALTEWIQEFSQPRHPPKKQMPPTFPPFAALPLNTCSTLPAVPTTAPTVLSPCLVSPIPCSLVLPTAAVDSVDNPSFVQPSVNIVNSLVNDSESDSDTDSISDSGGAAEPMECAPVPSNLPKNPSMDSLMQVEMEPVPGGSKCDNQITLEDVAMLVDFFYLPFEHGFKGLEILSDLNWLICNAHLCRFSKKKSAEKKEWEERARKMQDHFRVIERMARRFFNIANKSLVHSMYPYLWDLLGILNVSEAYVHWLGLGQVPYVSVCQMQRHVTWFTNGYREAFLSGDQEPWVFRGGLQAEFQRLLPIESAHDLFFMKPPDVIVDKAYYFRPYRNADEKSIYQICLKTCDDGMDGSDVFPESPNLIGDRLLGALVTTSSEYCFVVEDNDGVCGYALAALDAKVLHQKSKVAWIPSMQEKYPKPEKEEMTPADEVIVSLHNEQPAVNEAVYSRYPSVIRLDILASRIADPAVPKRLLSCVLSALKTNGSTGVHCELNVGDKYLIDFYSQLGFFPLTIPETAADGHVYVGRII